MTISAEQRRAIAADVRHVLACVRDDEARPIDVLDDVLLDRAADVLAVIFLFDAGMKLGAALSPEGITMYRDACADRDALLAEMKIEDPYRLPRGKLS
jgi:hypothetical protein